MKAFIIIFGDCNGNFFFFFKVCIHVFLYLLLSLFQLLLFFCLVCEKMREKKEHHDRIFPFPQIKEP